MKNTITTLGLSLVFSLVLTNTVVAKSSLVIKQENTSGKESLAREKSQNAAQASFTSTTSNNSLFSYKSETAQATAAWTEKSELKAMERIDVLVQSGTLGSAGVNLVRNFKTIGANNYVKPSIVLEALESQNNQDKWSNKDLKNLAVFLLKVKKLRRTAHSQGRLISLNEAFEHFIENEEAFCKACGCRV